MNDDIFVNFFGEKPHRDGALAESRWDLNNYRKRIIFRRKKVMAEKKKGGGALLGAAFLMATSAIGPGFLTQTATFTGSLKSSFGFVILVSIILCIH